VFALNTNLNIGQRHLLPTIPATYILLGSLGTVLLPVRKLRRVSVETAAAVGEALWRSVRDNCPYTIRELLGDLD
jgi:hypothetical protein